MTLWNFSNHFERALPFVPRVYFRTVAQTASLAVSVSHLGAPRLCGTLRIGVGDTGVWKLLETRHTELLDFKKQTLRAEALSSDFLRLSLPRNQNWWCEAPPSIFGSLAQFHHSDGWLVRYSKRPLRSSARNGPRSAINARAASTLPHRFQSRTPRIRPFCR